MKKNALLSTILLLTITAVGASAQGFADVSPLALNLTLGSGETTVETVSLTIHPLCVRPFNVDVVASDAGAIVSNLTGVVVNGCGGDTSSFDVQFTGTGAAQSFDLQFVDADFGGLLATIPVTIAPSDLEPLIGLIFRPRAIIFQVYSSGCTTKGDFRLEVLESLPLQLRLIRINEDPCDAFVPLGARIRFSYRSLGLEPSQSLRVVNPLGVVEVP